jgi:8-oxo-dGTP pyrophosphatase MutT (NUDIX family)
MVGTIIFPLIGIVAGGMAFGWAKPVPVNSRNFRNVTGKVDKGEKYTQAALRESQEETGLKTKNIKAIYKSTMKYTFIDQWEKNVKEKIFFLECYDKWDVVIDPSEHCEYKWVDENEINRDSVHFDSNYRALLAAKELAN